MGKKEDRRKEGIVPLYPEDEEEIEEAGEEQDIDGYGEEEEEITDSAQKNADSITSVTFARAAEVAARRRRLYKIITIAVSSILVIIFITAFFFLFFKVENIEVEGDTRYDYEEIIAAAGIEKGTNLYAIDKYEIEEKIIESCPYIKTVYITRTFPSTLNFKVSEETPEYYFSLANEYFILSDSLRVIDKVNSMSGMFLQYPHIIKLNPQSVKKAIVGETVVFDNEGYIEYAVEMLGIFKNSALGDSITLVDFSDRFKIFFIYADRFRVDIGDISDVEKKIIVAQKVIESLSAKDKGTINVEDDPAFYIMGNYET